MRYRHGSFPRPRCLWSRSAYWLWRGKRRGFLLAASALCLAYGAAQTSAILRAPLADNHVARLADGSRLVLRGVVAGPPDHFPDRTRYAVMATGRETDGGWAPVTGKILCTFGHPESEIRTGDRIRFACRLRRPANHANPGGFDYERFLAFRGIRATGRIAGKTPPVIEERGLGNPLLVFAEQVRARIRNLIDERFEAPEKEIVKALVIGEKRGIPEDMQEIYRATGVAHILAISGFHVGIVAGFAFGLLWLGLTLSRRVLLSVNVPKAAAAFAIPFVVLFTLVAGYGVSTVRACIMVTVYLLAVILDRGRDLLNAVAVAALLILLARPPSLFEVSFQLSFAAVICIGVLLPRLMDWSRSGSRLDRLTRATRWRRGLLWYVAITLAAGVGTMPLLAFHFNRITPVNLLTNVLMVPIIGGIGIPLALAGSLMVFVYAPLADFLFGLAIVLLKTVNLGLEQVARTPVASLWVGTPRGFEVAAVYLVAASLLLWKRGALPKVLAALGLGAILATEAILPIAQRPAEPTLTVLDVGQGECLLLELPGPRRILIDGGGTQGGGFDYGRQVVAPYLWHRRISRLDVVILTHPHPDHYDGLRFVCGNFEVGRFWWTGLKSADPRFEDLMRILEEEKIPRVLVHAGFKPEDPALQGLEILFPPRSSDADREFESWNLNERSLVMRFVNGKSSVLLTGDASGRLETWLAQNRDVRASVLKAGHHGEDDAGSRAFLERVRPDAALISCGLINRYNAPGPMALARLERIGASIYRTDLMGALTVSLPKNGEIGVARFLSANRSP